MSQFKSVLTADSSKANQPVPEIFFKQKENVFFCLATQFYVYYTCYTSVHLGVSGRNRKRQFRNQPVRSWRTRGPMSAIGSWVSQGGRGRSWAWTSRRRETGADMAGTIVERLSGVRSDPRLVHAAEMNMKELIKSLSIKYFRVFTHLMCNEHNKKFVKCSDQSSHQLQQEFTAKMRKNKFIQYYRRRHQRFWVTPPTTK